MRAGLAGLPGVTAVRREAGSDLFFVHHRTRLDGALDAVAALVLFPGIRRWLARIAKRENSRA